MSTIKIEFPADRPDIAKELGRALLCIGRTPDENAFNEEVDAAKSETGLNVHTIPDNGGPGVAAESEGTDAGEHQHPFNKEAATSGYAGQPATGAPSMFDSVPVDHHGVPKNPDYCGNAADPYYGSGKRLGQWKKRKGVSDADYDAWYTGELAKLEGQPEQHAEESHPDPVNTAGAFASQPAQQPQQADAPTEAGGLMGWVSQKQAAGLLTQQDFQEACQREGVQVTDLFPPNDPQTIAQHVGQIYHALAAKAGG